MSIKISNEFFYRVAHFISIQYCFQNAVCSPASMSCDLYMKQKLLNFKGPEMQRKRAVQLTEVPQHIKPVNGITRKEIQEAKGNEKRTRMDDNQLTSRLLELFEKHQVCFLSFFQIITVFQYYTLKDLCDITKQPTAFLKEKLKEIAVYNSRVIMLRLFCFTDSSRRRKETCGS